MHSSYVLNALLNHFTILLIAANSVIHIAADSLEEGETFLLFKDVMELAKRAMNDDCGCLPTHRLSFNPGYQRRVSELIRHLEDLAEAEVASDYGKTDANRRIKRFYHTYTFRSRIALPPGATMVLTPTFHLPFVRDLPRGFISNMTLSFPFTGTQILKLLTDSLLNLILLYSIPSPVSFDSLGLTDNSNIFGVFPILRRIFRLLFGKRKPRAIDYNGGHRY